MTGSRSRAYACGVAWLMAAITLDPGIARSQQANPTEAEVDQAVQNCSPTARNDENITAGLKLLKTRMLGGEGVFPLADIPAVVGVGFQADTAIVPIFDKIQSCVADKLSGHVRTHPTTIWLGSTFMDRGDFGPLNPRSTFFIKIDGQQIMALDFSKPLGSPPMELAEGDHSFEFSGELQDTEDGTHILRGACAGKFEMKKSAVLAPHVRLDKAKGVFSDCAIRVE